MQNFINEFKEPEFEKVSDKTVSKLFSQPRIKFYRKIVTVRKIANRILSIPQRTEIIKLPYRFRVLQEYFPHENEEYDSEIIPTILVQNSLSKNIVVEHKKFKNKTIISVKTDIDNIFLSKI